MRALRAFLVAPPTRDEPAHPADPPGGEARRRPDPAIGDATVEGASAATLPREGGSLRPPEAAPGAAPLEGWLLPGAGAAGPVIVKPPVAPPSTVCVTGRPRDVQEAAAQPRSTAASVAVLAAPVDVRALGVAAGLVLARRTGAGCTLVCVWRAEAPPGAARRPARRSSHRLAASLTARGIDAAALGRLAVAELPAEPGAAHAEATQALDAAGATPAVLALGGPRDEAFDALLAEQDVAVVAVPPNADEALRALAVAGVPARAVRSCDVRMHALARIWATAGLLAPPGLNRALAQALEGR